MTVHPRIPMSSPDLTAAEIEAVIRVLQTPYLSLGPRIDEFEERFAAYTGAKYAIAVSSGTTGLHLCVIAAGVGEGDLVITTPFSFIASANCILYERAIPVFVDVDPTGNLDPALVAAAADDIARGGEAAKRWLPPSLRHQPSAISHQPSAISHRLSAISHQPSAISHQPSAISHRLSAISHQPSAISHQPLAISHRLSAILPVHAFGQPADMDTIQETARQYNLAVIEDACEAIGAEYKGRKAGTLGGVAVFAFYPNKQMTTGEGGMIVTDNEEWANIFRSLRNQGRDVFDAWLNHTRLGYNYRLDEMSAALGLAQMQRIEELLNKRERVAGWYNERLADQELIERPYIAPTTTRTSWFVYVVRIKPPANRDEVMRLLAKAGIPSRPYFTPIHLQPFYRQTFGYRRGDFPVTEHLGDVSLALPFSSVMTEEQVDYVCEHLGVALQQRRGEEGEIG